MSLSTASALADDTAMCQRIEQSMIRQALIVAAESGSTSNHANRLLLANAVLNNPGYKLRAFSGAVVADDTTVAASTDAVIAARVGAIWDAMSGIPV